MWFSKSKKTEKAEKERQLLLAEILKAKGELTSAMSNFNFAETPDLVELYSQQITVAQIRYDILTKKAKENNLRFEGVPLKHVHL